jgi:putative spermidine/putrescine transport system substrate-binding protein
VPRELTLAACAVALLVACGGKPERELTVVGWGGSSQAAHREAYWHSFSQQTGVKLHEDSWNGGLRVLRSKMSDGARAWDVVQVEVEELMRGCQDGLFAPLDWPALGGREAYLDVSVHDCGVGAMVWSEVFAYDGNRISEPPHSWADFWDVAKFPGGRGMRRSPKYTLEAALMADGVQPADLYAVLATAAGIDRAFQKLDELKPSIVWLTSVAQVPGLLASGNVAMSMATPGRLLLANQTDRLNLKVVWDGNIYAVDFWAVPAGSRHRAQAMELIRYMKRPENEARLPLFIATGLSNKQAIAALDPALTRDTPTNPDNLRHAVALDARFWMQNSDALTERFNAWMAQ